MLQALVNILKILKYSISTYIPKSGFAQKFGTRFVPWLRPFFLCEIAVYEVVGKSRGESWLPRTSTFAEHRTRLDSSGPNRDVPRTGKTRLEEPERRSQFFPPDLAALSFLASGTA